MQASSMATSTTTDTVVAALRQWWESDQQARVLIDPEGRIILSTGVYAALCGTRSEALAGREFWLDFIEVDRPLLRTAVGLAFARGEPASARAHLGTNPTRVLDVALCRMDGAAWMALTLTAPVTPVASAGGRDDFALAERLGSALLAVDATQIVTRATAAARALLETPERAVTGAPLALLLQDADLSVLAHGGGALRPLLEGWIATANLGRRYVEVRPQLGLSPLVGEASLLEIIDRTEYLLATEALAESESRFREFMTHLPGFAWIKDAAGRMLWANTQFERLHDGRRSSWFGKTDLQLWGETVARQLRAGDLRVLEGLRPTVTEEIFPLEGEPVGFRLSRFPLRGPSNEARQLAAIAFPRETPGAEARTGVAAWLTDAVVESLGLGLVDAEGRVQYLTGRCSAVLGAARALVPGTAWPEVFSAGVHGLVEGLLQRANSGQTVTETLKGLPIDVEAQGYRLVCSPCGDGGSAGGHILLVLPEEPPPAGDRLTTALVQQLHRLMRALHLPLERLAALERSRMGDATAVNLVRRSVSAAETVSQLLECLSTYVGSGSLNIQASRVDLSALATEVLPHVAEAHARAQPRFHIEPGLVVWGDRQLLRLVVEHLLDNACKYASVLGPPEVALEAVASAEGACFRVRDNGPGFEPRDARRLFKPFQRLPGAADVPGFGLGLALVERIIGRHRGRVWADAIVGEGAAFYVVLPESPG
jgi:signal transduction histidine kinase/PAS domain-containing protein